MTSGGSASDRTGRRLDSQLLSDLHIFDQVVRAGGMAAAGRRIGISQGAVSQRIARLEARLGCALFVRGREGLTLTQRGGPLASAVRDGLDHVCEAVSDLKPGRGHTVRVNCTPSLASEWLVPALDDFYVEHPDMDLVIYADQALLTAARISDEGLDIGIRYAPDPLPGVIKLAAVPEEVAPVCAPGYLADVGRPVVRLHDDTPWIGAPENIEWDGWETQAGPLPVPIQRDQRFNLAALAYDAAAAGRGVAMGRLALASGRLRSGALVAASAKSAPGAVYWIVSKGPASEARPVRRFVAWAERHLLNAQALARSALERGSSHLEHPLEDDSGRRVPALGDAGSQR